MACQPAEVSRLARASTTICTDTASKYLGIGRVAARVTAISATRRPSGVWTTQDLTP